MKRAAELSREWDRSIYICQVDLSKAFDKVKHSAVIGALKLQGCSLQCLVVLCAMLSQSSISTVLGHVQAQATSMNRGLPQGAPESPLIFTLVTEYVLRPLLGRWRVRGSGWKLDDFWLPCVCFADDILLISSSKRDLERMLAEVVEAFLATGLGVSPHKCHWTSRPKADGENILISGEAVAWEQDLIFVGSKLVLSGNDGAAMEHRQAQGSKAFYKWRPFLQCRHVSLRRRFGLLTSTAFSTTLWLCQTWLPTKAQEKHLNSWGARLVARMACVQRSPLEDLGQYWRRMHRFGHQLMQRNGGSMSYRRRMLLHGFAKHLARSTGTVLATSLRTRCLPWWRFHQETQKGERYGLHPRRFKTWRWESQLEAYYGESSCANVGDTVGWMLRAQGRDAWRAGAVAFASG